MKNNNIKRNNLTLNSLQAELDLVKANNKANQQATKIQSMFSKSYLVLIMLITFANKIPIVAKITKILSLWYGKTKWWQLLVKARKVFIVLNAIIGVFFSTQQCFP